MKIDEVKEMSLVELGRMLLMDGEYHHNVNSYLEFLKNSDYNLASIIVDLQTRIMGDNLLFV